MLMKKFCVSACLISLTLGLGGLGCGGGGNVQTFLEESGAAHEKVEQMNWSKEPSAYDTNWTTYEDLEGA
jgi:hypothetical protein